jgi:CubicO group peptidase (beta-lactamase class C family)
MKSPRWRQLDAWIRATLERAGVPGAAVAVFGDGDFVYQGLFGWRDREQRLPVTAHTGFGAGSLSKSLTALAIMQLAETGLLALSDPVARYLPGFRVPSIDGEITIHHLLSHTAGLPPLELMARMQKAAIGTDWRLFGLPDAPAVESGADLLAALTAWPGPPAGRPGERFSYSNEGYAVLALVVEAVSGLSIIGYLRTRILEPLGLERMSGFAPPPPPSETSQLYRWDRGAVRAAPGWWHGPLTSGVSGWIVSAEGLARYLSLYLPGPGEGGGVVSPVSIRRMLTPVAKAAPDWAYGYAFLVAHGRAFHGGRSQGVAAWVSLARDAGTATLALTNLSDGPAALLAGAADRVWRGNDPAEAEEGVQPSDSAPEPGWLGHYGSRDGVGLHVLAGGPGLQVRAAGATWPAWVTGRDTALATVRGEAEPLEFFRTPDGRVWGLRYHLRVLHRVTPFRNDKGRTGPNAPPA